jgi:hypothetical protein
MVLVALSAGLGLAISVYPEAIVAAAKEQVAQAR